MNKEELLEIGVNESVAPNVLELYNKQLESEKNTIRNELSSLANENAKKILDGFALKLTDLTGLARNSGEKSSDFASRVLPEYIDKEASSYRAQIKELEERIDQGISDQQIQEEYSKTKNQLKLIQQQLADLQESSALELENKSKEFERFRNESSIMSLLPKLAEDLDPYGKKARIELLISDLLDNFELEYDASNNFIARQNGKVQPVKELIESHEAIKDVIFTERQIQGGGARTDQSKMVLGNMNVPDISDKLKGQDNPLSILTSEFEKLARERNISPLDPGYSELNREFVKKNSQLTI